jgi:hypothetical protein
LQVDPRSRKGVAAVPLAIDAVVTHHLDGYRSGVARFNELLAEHLGVPLLGVLDDAVSEARLPLLSFKVSELGASELSTLSGLLDRSDWRPQVFLHEFVGLPLEGRLIEHADRVLCGNHAIHARVEGLNPSVDTMWTPGLVLDDRTFEPAEISVFSFGMAHKIRTDMFERLRELLEASGRSWTLYVSAANHETASLRDAQVVFEKMHELFPRGLYFLGNLSDVAVSNYLRETTFFAAFFSDGVRANNTSVASALERGSVVITNMDEYSPPEFVHLENVIDITRCDALPSDPLTLKRISVRAMETGASRSWERLVGALRA